MHASREMDRIDTVQEVHSAVLNTRVIRVNELCADNTDPGIDFESGPHRPKAVGVNEAVVVEKKNIAAGT
jgi:hypothetical protein